MDHISFAEAEYIHKRRTTRREMYGVPDNYLGPDRYSY